MDREASGSSDDLVIFQDTVNSDGDSVSPQVSCKYGGCWGNLVKLSDGVVYDLLAMSS